MSGVTYISRSGLSINEGGRYINLHIGWWSIVGFYIYVFGKRFYWFRVPT